MKTKLVIAAALLVCACHPIPNDLEKYALDCKAAEVSVQCDTLERNYTVKFNPQGRVTEIETFNDDGSFRFRESFGYDKRGRLTDVIGINSENETEERYEYDWKGSFIRECRMYGMNNEELHRWAHDNDGRHIVRTEYYGEGELSYITTKDFGKDSYVETTCAPDSSLIGKAKIEFFRSENKPTRIEGSNNLYVEIDYNEKGLPVRSLNTVLNSLGEMEWVLDLETHPERYYSYEYDERGNWISRALKVHPDSTVISVLKRSIKY